MAALTPIVHVCIPQSKRDYFDYSTTDVIPAVGARVWVPFGKQTRLGIVIRADEQHNPSYALKPILTVLDETPLISADILALCQWVSTYYQSPLSEVLPFALPKHYRLGRDACAPVTLLYTLATSETLAHCLIPKKASRQHALIDFFVSQAVPLSKKALATAGFNSTPLKALLSLGLLSEQALSDAPEPICRVLGQPLPLNAEQAYAVNILIAAQQSFHCFLLHGVTGSGKTEVYWQVITHLLKAQKQVLVLVPEIGLTPQLLARFHDRFHERLVVMHSQLSEHERAEAWRLASQGIARVVIGTRSAVFAPLPHLGLIIIDEEHDASFKQLEGVRYSARDTALVRAQAANIPIILGSATPSLESLYNSTSNKYTRLSLTQKALTNTPLHYQLLDLRNQPTEQGLAQPTLHLISEHLKQNNQVLVFINRRGFSPVLLCHQCGWMADCQACDSHFTLHQKKGQLICHHCGRVERVMPRCPSCRSQELIPIGAGTQRVHEHLQRQFPSTMMVRIDRDEIRNKEALEASLASIVTGEAQLIIGTQLLAKGHHFPRLTLVVVLEADAGFYNQDFRALERLGQLLTQVAGRAGRADRPGQVLIQTHLPDHPMLNLLIQHGYEPFAQALLNSRKQAQLPPFYFLAMIRAQAPTIEKARAFLQEIKTLLATAAVDVFGPAPAPLARQAGQHRLQLLIRCASRKTLGATLTRLRDDLSTHKLRNSVRWHVDVDPVDLS